VLRAQDAALALAKPGATFEDLDRAARRVIDEAGYGDYFIHGLGHFVGLDVHDAGAYHEKLEPGMVLTLEPGVYIPEKTSGYASKTESSSRRRERAVSPMDCRARRTRSSSG
jgi:Xaa-Pro aminopeptidase